MFQHSLLRCRLGHRLIGGAVLVCALTPLILAAWMVPDTSGQGTHRQLGLAECGFRLRTGLPCATCGMTTAFSYATHGQPLHSLLTQPAGFILCLATAISALLGGWAMFSGMSLQPISGVMGRPMVFVLIGGGVLVSWGYTLMMDGSFFTRG